MIIVPVKEGENVDKALKKLKRKFEKLGIVKELRERQKFSKPSVKRRSEIIKARYIQRLKNEQFSWSEFSGQKTCFEQILLLTLCS